MLSTLSLTRPHDIAQAEPRFATARRPWRPTSLDHLTTIGREIGQLPMPWQVQVLSVAGEMLTVEECEALGVPFGTPAYREVWITVPRQAGKTTIVLIMLVDRGIDAGGRWRRAQRSLYTAQTGKAARKKLLTDMEPTMRLSASIDRRMGRTLRGVGHELVQFVNGGQITPGNNTESASHGETLDFGVIDEAFDDVDDRREQAMIPAMATKPMAQILGVSTAGTPASLYLNRKVKIGREAVAADKGRGVAYFEWSAAPEDDPYDEKVWWATHPALGFTVPIDVMRHAAQSMGGAEFKRAWLNVQSERGASRHIPAAAWADVCGDHMAFPDDEAKVIAVDVAADRSRGSIALGNTATSVVQLTDCEAGTGWIVDRVEAIKKLVGGSVSVVYDGAGPAANIGRDQTDWTPVGGHEMTAACSDFYDAVVSGGIKVRTAALLDAALIDAEVRRTGDRWAWSRSMSAGDISPLVAATLAACHTPKRSYGFVLT